MHKCARRFEDLILQIEQMRGRKAIIKIAMYNKTLQCLQLISLNKFNKLLFVEVTVGEENWSDECPNVEQAANPRRNNLHPRLGGCRIKRRLLPLTAAMDEV